jgi:ADP-ribose pyrophosphatase YjhB (NUDIX family)
MSASLVSLASLVDAFESMTPEIRLAAIIKRDGKLLLLQHQKKGARYWVLPGGRLQAGETLEAGLKRELREELGLRSVHVGALVIVCETLAPDRNVVNLIYQADIGEGRPELDRTDSVLTGMDWVPVSRLAELDFRPPIAATVAEVIASKFQGAARLLGDTWTPIRS